MDVRLQAVNPDRFDAAEMNGFEEITSVGLWRLFLRDIHRNHSPGNAFGQTLSANIAHRLQLLEFETALLLRHKEAPRSTLHVSVVTFKIHQHAVLCHSILEGLGAHFWRFQTGNVITAAAPAKRVPTRSWRAAIIKTCYPNIDPIQLGQLTDELEQLTAWRDKIHLDANQPWQAIDYNALTFEHCFNPTYELFRRLLTTLNPTWPADTCLNEDI